MALSASSLLATATARRAKILEQEDAQVAFEWSLSTKTYDDFVAYSNYLSDRAGKTTDPSKQLSYQKAIVGARKGYVSNDIQRANIDVIEGRSTDTAKYGTMATLYHQAIDNGDYDLAQSLNLQLDNLSVKIQLAATAAAEAAQRVASTLAQNGVKTLKDLATQIKTGDQIITLGNGTLVKPVKLLNNELQAGQGADTYFKDLYDTTKALQGLVVDAYHSATTQDAVNSIESSFKDQIEGTAKYGIVTGADGKTKQLSMGDIELAYRSQAANNPIYSVTTSLDQATGKQAFAFKENKIDDFTWTRNDDGSYSATPTRVVVSSPGQTLDTQITKDGYVIGKGGGVPGQGSVNGGQGTAKNDTSLSIKNRLQSFGITATQGADGTLDLFVPGIGETKGTIMPDGSLRYFGPQGQYSGGNAGLYEVNIQNGQAREVAPDETSDFGTNSAFGGMLSQASQRGKNYIQQLAGLSPVSQVAPVDLRGANLSGMASNNFTAPNGINTAHDFSGTGSPVTSKLLQGASFTQGNIQQEKFAAIQVQAAAEAKQLQAANVSNLNQTPVAQVASNGAPIRQLTVAQPVAQPRVTVQPVKLPTISNAPMMSHATSNGFSLQGG